MPTLAFDKKVRIVSALVEGVSIRAAERLCDVSAKTIGRTALAVGEACRRLHNALMRDLQVAVLELDEIWAFIQKKQKRVTPQDHPDFGDTYTFLAIAASQKAIISFVVGKRDTLATNDFITDLRSRIVGRPQISTDGFVCYPDAIRAAFGDDVDYAQIIKEYGLFDDDDHKYSPPKCISAKRIPLIGNPDPDKISTSYVERGNLTLRMGCRRFTRLTNAFSRKMRNHAAAVALYVCWYNFVRIHETLRVTPCMALGVTDRVWGMAQLLDAALAIAPEDAPRLPPHVPEAQPGPAQAVFVDDRQLDLLAWQPRPLPPPRPSVDMEQMDLFGAPVCAEA